PAEGRAAKVALGKTLRQRPGRGGAVSPVKAMNHPVPQTDCVRISRKVPLTWALLDPGHDANFSHTRHPMTINPTDHAAVLARLERQNELLRWQNRWLKRSLLGLLVLAGATACLNPTVTGQAQGQGGRTLEVEKLVVRDKKGERRAELGMTAEGGAHLAL